METKEEPKMDDQAFEIRREQLMIEINTVMTKYDVHALIFAYGFNDGAEMRGGMGILGCAGCCHQSFDMMVSRQDAIRAKMMHSGHSPTPKVH